MTSEEKKKNRFSGWKNSINSLSISRREEKGNQGKINYSVPQLLRNEKFSSWKQTEEITGENGSLGGKESTRNRKPGLNKQKLFHLKNIQGFKNEGDTEKTDYISKSHFGS